MHSLCGLARLSGQRSAGLTLLWRALGAALALIFVLVQTAASIQEDAGSLKHQAAAIPCAEAAGIPSVAFLATKISLNLDQVPLSHVIKKLQGEQRLPISYIDSPSNVSVTLHKRNLQVSAILREIVSEQPEQYRCLVANGHVVVLPDEPRWFRRIEGINIHNTPRMMAAQQYVKILSSLKDFDGFVVVPGGLLESSVFSERVSLSPDGVVLEQLMQLLGDDEGKFFVIKRTPGGVEYLTVGSTMEPPSLEH